MDTEEEVGKLEGPAPIERVILGDEVKLYRIRALLAYLNGAVYNFEDAVLTLDQDPVPVYSDDGVNIGFAKVEVDVVAGVKRLLADITIDYSCGERLLIETGSEAVYARLDGSLEIEDCMYLDLQAQLMVRSLTLAGIVLTRAKAVDTQIPELGKPVL